MTRVALYARFSSALQSEASIEDQERLCRERALRDGWTVTAVYSDRAISGASLLRPGLQALLEGAQAGKFAVVLTEALDRLSRDQADVAALFKRLTFAGVNIVTLSEGEITELHVGLKGTMNQLFLKDLAAKTRRGLRGRVEQGLSGGGNSYGYEVVRRLGADGEPVTGERRILPAEAVIIRRVFREFADGISPLAIAHRLNSEGVPGPRGQLWRDTAIRGHQQRGTGLLNNELYIGRLIWNRLRYVKDPETGRRVSRLNPREAWTLTEVPQMRIIEDDLWARVKERQGVITADPRVQAIKASRFWEQRRATHLLSALVRCGSCGGTFAAVGKDYLACGTARKLKTCDNGRSVRRVGLEAVVLELLRTRLMQPDAVAEFVRGYAHEMNAQRGEETSVRQRQEAELAAVKRKLEGLYDAIADGLRTAGLKERLEDLERKAATLEAALSAAPVAPVRLHPNLSEIYRRKVGDLAGALNDESIRGAALETIRRLISSGKRLV